MFTWFNNPLFSSNPLLNLRSCQSSPFWKFGRFNPTPPLPPPQQKGGCTLYTGALGNTSTCPHGAFWHITKSSAYVAKPTSSASCSWWWLCYIPMKLLSFSNWNVPACFTYKWEVNQYANHCKPFHWKNTIFAIDTCMMSNFKP